MKQKYSNRFWIALLAAAFALCALAAWWVMRPAAGGRALAQIRVDGEIVREIDLSAVAEGFSFDIETPYGVNTVEVRPGGIRVSGADCPDRVCVQKGWLEGGLTPIVCLPHRLVISLAEGGEGAAFDAVAG